MEDRRSKQIAILKEMIAYSNQLIPALQLLIGEIRENRQEDTDEFLNEVITGINWEIEVYNQCASVLNEKNSYIDKKVMIRAVGNLGAALGGNDRWEIANCLEEDFLPFLNKLALAAKMTVGE